jgi:hypothetical protein
MQFRRLWSGTHKDKGKGRPKRSRQRTIREEALAAGKTWGEIKQLSENSVRWRHFVNALCSSES